jgi:hypothetical protein
MGIPFYYCKELIKFNELLSKIIFQSLFNLEL